MGAWGSMNPELSVPSRKAWFVFTRYAIVLNGPIVIMARPLPATRYVPDRPVTESSVPPQFWSKVMLRALVPSAASKPKITAAEGVGALPHGVYAVT